jgi:hypothetical protein
MLNNTVWLAANFYYDKTLLKDSEKVLLVKKIAAFALKPDKHRD